MVKHYIKNQGRQQLNLEEVLASGIQLFLRSLAQNHVVYGNTSSHQHSFPFPYFV
jgi:hypothetical protein